MAMAAAALWSCDSDEPAGDEQSMGVVELSATFDQNLGRSGESTDGLADACNIKIMTAEGIIRQYTGIDNVPNPLWLATGNYSVEVTAGDSVAASWDARYYRGNQSFAISRDKTTNVSVECKIANVVASVEYDEQVKDALNSYTLRVGHHRGWLEFVGDDTRKGYFMMPRGTTDLEWTLTATTFDGKPFSKSGIIRQVKRATEYRINIQYTGTVNPVGGAYMDIDVDASVEEINHNIEFAAEPEVMLVDGDITATQRIAKGTGRRLVVAATVPAGIERATMTSDFSLLGLDGLTSVNINHISDAESAALYSKGINVARRTADDGSEQIVVNFSAKLISLLPKNNYTFSFDVVDKQQRTATAALNIEITDSDAEN